LILDTTENSTSSSAEESADQRGFGPTEFSIVQAGDESNRLQGVALMLVGTLAMLVGIMGLLGHNVFERDRRTEER